MEIKGQIDEIIYQNEVNSYTVATFETEEELVTIVGYLPFINSGDTLKLIGKYVTHQEYGQQFKIETFEKIMPETLDALEKYLSNGTIKGIGPATARKIIKKFGEDTVYVLKFEAERLAEIKGITTAKAIEMGEDFTENWDLWEIVGFLEKFGIGVNNAKSVYKKLGKEAISKIEQDPYVLIDLAQGVDFKQVDKMALDLGFAINDDKRIKTGIKHSLNIVGYNGHTCVLQENLIGFVRDLLNVDIIDIEDGLIDLKAKEEIIIEEYDGAKWISLYSFYKAELNIASRIAALDNSKNVKKLPKFETEMETIEKNSEIELSDKQKEALEEINNNNVCIITGGPGTGKTTIIKSILQIYKSHQYNVVLCAPTGRAAKRMTETTGEEAKTLHRLLEIGKIEESDKSNIDFQGTPINADVIIVDEMSMVDIFLMNYLLNAVFLGTKLVLVGDADQLASVGPGSVLKDLIASEKVSTVFLNKIFRQAAKSKIIVNAHNVNSGISFVNSEKEMAEDSLEDFFFIKDSNQEKMLYNVLSLSKDRLKKFGDYDSFKDIQVITPTKKGMLGTKELNKSLQEVLNPASKNKQEKSGLGVTFRQGDKVMQVKNNYDIFWEKAGIEKENGTGIFNGEIGRIEKIDEVAKQIKVKFDDEKVAWYEFQDLEQLEHSYAITIHKAQGSEFDVVVMPIAPSSPMLLTRNLLYTGLTRAKKLLIVIGNEKIIDFMIQNVDSKKRNTTLEYKLSLI